MTVLMTDQTKVQNELVRNFLRQMESVKLNMIELAKAYKQCVDAGVDMSRYVHVTMAYRLERLADGRLLEAAHDRCLANPRMVTVLASVTREQQQDMLENGVPIWRDGVAKVINVDDVMPHEASRLIDATGGRARLLSPEEQARRVVTRAVPRHDKVVELRLTPEECEALVRGAKKNTVSLAHYIKQQLYLHGIIPSAAKPRKPD